jgi:hypothetical protein
LKVPFRNLLVFPNQVPWPGRLENSTFSEILDAGRTREIQTKRLNKKRPAATLLLSVNCLYQMNKKNCKHEFENCVGLPFWCRPLLRLPEFNLQIVVQHDLFQDARQAVIVVLFLLHRPLLYVAAIVPRLSAAKARTKEDE